jgi:hypothetical protein
MDIRFFASNPKFFFNLDACLSGRQGRPKSEDPCQPAGRDVSGISILRRE